MRKPEILQGLEDKGFKSIGGLFLKGLNQHKATHSIAIDTDFDAAKGHGADVQSDAIKRSHSKKGMGDKQKSEIKQDKSERKTMTAQEKLEQKAKEDATALKKQKSEKSGHHKHTGDDHAIKKQKSEKSGHHKHKH